MAIQGKWLGLAGDTEVVLPFPMQVDFIFNNIETVTGAYPTRAALRAAIEWFIDDDSPGNVDTTIESIARMYEHERGVTLEVGDTQA